MEASDWVRRDSLLGDAAVGALVTVVLSFLPFSSIAGGVVAGHRRGGRYLSGLAAGALAGFLAAVPFAVLFVPALRIATALGFGVAPTAPAYEAFLAIVGALFLVYTVGLSALAGLAGTWLARHTDWRLDPAAWT